MKCNEEYMHALAFNLSLNDYYAKRKIVHYFGCRNNVLFNYRKIE
jgi:hypothetical protein